MSPPIAYQIICALNIIMGRDGTNDGNNYKKKTGEILNILTLELLLDNSLQISILFLF
jgi:hypothetical protein